MQVEILDELCVFVIAEANIVNIRFAADIFQHARFLGNLLRCFQQLENARCTCKRILHFRDDRADVVERLHILVGIGKQHRKTADRKPTAQNDKGAQKCHACINDIVDKPRGRVGKAAVKHSLQAAIGKLTVDLGKPCRGLVLIAERMHDLLSADHFFDESSLAAANLALLAEHTERTRGHEFRYKKA